MLTELRNRGVADVYIACCDGLKGLPDAIRATWPDAEVQLCVVHLVRSPLRFTSKKYWVRCAETCARSTPPPLSRRPRPASPPSSTTGSSATRP